MYRDKIMALIDKDAGGCWLWSGPMKDTHPIMYTGGDKVVVKRAVYEIVIGTIPPHHAVHRECSDARCVNPRHAKLIDRTPIGQRQMKKPFCLRPIQPSQQKNVAASGIKSHRDRVRVLRQERIERYRALGLLDGMTDRQVENLGRRRV